MSATLVFTPIVHGPHDGRPSDGTLRCTVHVGLRLNPGADPALGTLAGWPLILNWPQNAVSAALVSPDGSVSAAVDVPATDPALWQAFSHPRHQSSHTPTRLSHHRSTATRSGTTPLLLPPTHGRPWQQRVRRLSVWIRTFPRLG